MRATHTAAHPPRIQVLEQRFQLSARRRDATTAPASRHFEPSPVGRLSAGYAAPSPTLRLHQVPRVPAIESLHSGEYPRGYLGAWWLILYGTLGDTLDSRANMRQVYRNQPGVKLSHNVIVKCSNFGNKVAFRPERVGRRSSLNDPACGFLSWRRLRRHGFKQPVERTCRRHGFSIVW